MKGVSLSNNTAALFERGKKSGSRRRKANDDGNEESAADILGLLDSVEICTQGFTHQSLNGVSEGCRDHGADRVLRIYSDAMPPPSFLPSRILHERTQLIAENSNIQIPLRCLRGSSEATGKR